MFFVLIVYFVPSNFSSFGHFLNVLRIHKTTLRPQWMWLKLKLIKLSYSLLMLYSLVAYFVISYHVPKMARAALLSCDPHGGKKACMHALWLPGETTSETTSFGLLFITNTAIFTQISSRPISNPIKIPCFVPDNRILYWLPTRWSCWEIFFHNQSFLDCRVLQSGIGEHGMNLDNMKDIKKT